MTPAATTPAGRAGAAKKATASTAPAPGHRRGLRQPPAPRSPRRVSGPVRGRVAAPPRPQFAPRRSAPARPLGARAVAFVRALPDHSLLDRIVRGRSWIPLLGVMLAGIVAMQVEVLKLGASMGRSIQLGTALQSRNELLRDSVATLADDQRIERLAAGMGMVMPAPDGVGFLAGGSPNAERALANIHAPNPTSFLSLLSANGAVTVAPSSSAATGTTSSLSSGATAVTTAPSVGASAATTGSATAPSAAGSAATTPSTGASTPSPGAGTQTSSAGQTTGGTGAAAATQVIPTQSSSSQSSASATGGAGVTTGG